MRACPDCGGPVWSGRTRCRACYRRWVASSGNPRWKGEVRDQGYVYVRSDHPRANRRGYVKRADLVLEAKLGRPLQSGEMAHHINGVRDDDRPENLEAVSKSEHGGKPQSHACGEKHPGWKGGRRICPRCGGRKKFGASLCRACHVKTGRAREAVFKAWEQRRRR